MNSIRIGVPQSGYAVDRNIPQVAGFERVRPWDYHRARTALLYKTQGKLDKYHQFSVTPPFFPRVELFHFFNSISYTATPWLTTYEGIIPRWGYERSAREVDRGINSILGSACKGIIGFSQVTEHVLEQFFISKGYTREWNAIASKRHVMLPPQPLFPETPRKSEVVQFCFVGGDFYRKGGAETIAAFYDLLERGIKNWKLTVVGDLTSWGDYASKTTKTDEETTRLLISKMSGYVEHHTKLPNVDVMNLLGQSHYLVFPTFQDTFGYVVLESMANGCVPITSKTRVFPEIIRHGENGFLIEVPTDSNGDAHRTATSPEEKEKLTSMLREVIAMLLSQSEEVWPLLSDKCRAYIAQYHDKEAFIKELKKIYLLALNE
jgi:glycosyltransferase involved in cell wall biosynthesis